MQLIERNNNSGVTRTVKVLERYDSPENANIVVEGVYSRGLGIQHFLVEAAGDERQR
jgi:hypothetical protein